MGPTLPDELPGANSADPSPTGRHMARGAFAVLSTQPFTWAASLASAVLVPRFLGADGLGRFAIAWTIASLAGLIASAGLPQFVGRKVATEPARAATYAWGGLVVVALSSLVVAIGVGGGIAALHVAAVDLELVAIGMVAAVTAAAQGIMTGVLMGVGRHVRYALTSASYALVGTGCGLGALLLGADARGYALALLSGWTGVTALLWLTSGLPFGRAALRPSLLRELFVGGFPFVGWNLALGIRGQTDVMITGLLLQPSVAGWLGAAYRIINFAVFIPTIIATPLLPALTRAKERPDRYRLILKESLATVLLLIVPVSAAIFVLAPFIPRLLGWPDELDHAIPLMMILAFQQTLVGVDFVLGVGLIALGLERKWLRVAVAGAVFNPLFNLAAIPIAQALTANGAIGAALVEVVTETLFLGGAIALMPKGILGGDMVKSAGRIVGCGAVFVAVATLLRPFGPFVSAGAGGLSYVVLAIAVGALRLEQIREVRLALRAA